MKHIYTSAVSRAVNALFFAALVLVPVIGFAQTEDLAKMRSAARQLIDAQKFTEALPLLDKLVVAFPKDGELHQDHGFALLGQSKNEKDAASAKQMRARARAAFVKALENGNDSELIRGLIEGIPQDGGADATFSSNAKVDEIMQRAEAAFSSGKMDEALSLYQEALKLDPKQYHAALFSGDVYTQKQKWQDAETSYQQAIAINPLIETAYRYSATPLMKQGKYDQARDRYIEAWIVEPYSRFPVQGMIQWANATQTSLGHPKFDIPETKIGADGKQNTTINVNPLADDGSMAWIAYSATREVWKKDKFAKTFPNEKTYRHSLAEEVDALRSVVSMAKTVKAKSLSQQFVLLEKMDKEGVLEAYILMAIPTQGIARDHAAYLKANRDKMRQYVLNYVIGKK